MFCLYLKDVSLIFGPSPEQVRAVVGRAMPRPSLHSLYLMSVGVFMSPPSQLLGHCPKPWYLH